MNTVLIKNNLMSIFVIAIMSRAHILLMEKTNSFLSIYGTSEGTTQKNNQILYLLHQNEFAHATVTLQRRGIIPSLKIPRLNYRCNSEDPGSSSIFHSNRNSLAISMSNKSSQLECNMRQIPSTVATLPTSHTVP